MTVVGLVLLYYDWKFFSFLSHDFNKQNLDLIQSLNQSLRPLNQNVLLLQCSPISQNETLGYVDNSANSFPNKSL